MKKNNNNDEAKKVLNSVGLESPSLDFTLSVMDRIATEKVLQPESKVFSLKKYFFLIIIPVVAIFYYTPSFITLVSKINIDLTSINLDFLNIWFVSFKESLKFSISPAIISIILASFLLIGIFVMSVYSNTEETETI